MLRPLIAFLTLLLVSDAFAASNELSPTDIRAIKRICQSLIGAKAWTNTADPIFDQFKPYLRKGASLREARIVTCSGACGGNVPLRGGGEVYYGFPNTPDGLPGAGQDRFDTVALHIHGKRIFAFGPGTEYYPYPLYEEEHKKR
jgi:hypothetical protein